MYWEGPPGSTYMLEEPQTCLQALHAINPKHIQVGDASKVLTYENILVLRTRQ